MFDKPSIEKRCRLNVWNQFLFLEKNVKYNIRPVTFLWNSINRLELLNKIWTLLSLWIYILLNMWQIWSPLVIIINIYIYIYICYKLTYIFVVDGKFCRYDEKKGFVYFITKVASIHSLLFTTMSVMSSETLARQMLKLKNFRGDVVILFWVWASTPLELIEKENKTVSYECWKIHLLYTKAQVT